MSIYNTPLEERFGEKLEELREGKNMTREQLAEQVGLTARHIAALERGERRPTLNTMEKLLRALILYCMSTLQKNNLYRYY